MADAIRAFRRDLNVILSRGVWRIFGVALSQARQTLDARALLDFSGVLERAVRLLKDMDELPRAATSSKHATVMCSSTSSRTRAGRNGTWWRNWSGAGVQASARPQTRSSVHLHRRRSKAIDLRLPRRGCGGPRRSRRVRRRPSAGRRCAPAISVSFRAVPELLAFVNDVFEAIDKAPERHDAFSTATPTGFRSNPPKTKRTKRRLHAPADRGGDGQCRGRSRRCGDRGTASRRDCPRSDDGPEASDQAGRHRDLVPVA